MRWIVRYAVFVAAVHAVTAMPAAQVPAKDPAIAVRHDDPKLVWGPCPELFPKGCEVTVLHGEPAGRPDVFLRVPAGYAIPPHAHTSPEHMILVAGEMHLKYDGQPEQTLTTGSFAYGPAGRGHDARCGTAGPCVLFIAFEGPMDVLPFTGKR